MSVTGTTVRELMAGVPAPGRLTWIGLRTAKRGPIEVVREAEAVAGRGLLGDRKAASGRVQPSSRRQVTLVPQEHLAAIGAYLGQGPVDPVLLRRNLVVAGINLAVAEDRRIRVGEVVLEATGACHPCSRMEEALGPGGYQAVRGHGGLTARILTGGSIRVGDEVVVLPPEDGAREAAASGEGQAPLEHGDRPVEDVLEAGGEPGRVPVA